MEAEFYHTSLKGIDLSNSEISGIRITNLANSELRGSSVSSLQALELIRMLGIEIIDLTPSSCIVGMAMQPSDRIATGCRRLHTILDRVIISVFY